MADPWERINLSPIDHGVKRYWQEWDWGLDEVLRNNPESAGRLRCLMTTAIASMLRAALNHSDAARIQWQRVAQKYRERWAQGDLDGIVPVLADLVLWLRSAGIDPARNADVVALLNDPCVARARSRMPTVEYDPNFLDMFRRLAVAIGR
ncbi:MAG: hypothetical protein JWR32_2550 [Mycobacterium sp.]|jgi:hypothetical protein|nr:hypothetical protein [Mycobacterium sp.]